jgi:hypothetical protein
MATTVNEVRVMALVGPDTDQAISFHHYSAAAIAVVDYRFVAVDQTVKNMIAEHWTAHYLELEGISPGLVSKRIGDASWSWSNDALKGLGSTRNGQIVMALDPTGILAEANKPKPQFNVL